MHRDERNQWILENYGLAVYVTKKIFRNQIPLEDVVQLALEGLCIAAKYHDGVRGQFYTCKTIRDQILRYMHKEWKDVFCGFTGQSSQESGFREDPVSSLPDPQDVLLDIERAEQIEKMISALEILSERERKYLMRIYGIRQDKESCDEIACSDGISKSRVTQITRRAVMKLRAHGKENGWV